MVTSIQLGNIFSQNGKTVVGGSASGFDIEGLIDGLAEARRLPAVKLEGKIEDNALKSTALTDLRSLLNDFKDAANFLRSPPGVNNETDNIFEYRSADVASNSTVSGDTYMNVTAKPGAPIGEYDITVDQLATRNNKTTDTFALAETTDSIVGSGGPFNAGVFALGPNNVEITLVDGDSLDTVVGKINAVKESSNVEASYIKVSDGNYRISFKTTETGTDMNYDMFGGNGSLPAGQIFHFDATDLDGDGDTLDNPSGGFSLSGNGWNDAITGGLAGEAGGGAPTLNDPGINGHAAVDFSTATSSVLIPPSTADINTGGPYTQKTHAFAIETGSDVSGTQTIFEQGNSNRSFGVFIAPDAANGNAPTLFATVHNDTEWTGADQWKTVNLGTVTANTSYNIVVEFDASANPAAHDPANTMKGYVNGTLMDTATGLQQQYAHNGTIGIGASTGGVGFPDETTSNSTSAFYTGLIGEIVGTNSIMSDTERTSLDSYLNNKWQNPTPPDNAAVFNIGFAIEDDAVDAQMTLDGTVITRQNNSFDDVIEDITFNLENETPVGTELTVKIEPDTELAKQGVVNFVDSYNAFRLYASSQSETDDSGVPKDTAILSSDPTMRLSLNRIYAEMSQEVDGIIGDDFARLSDLGITFDDFPGDDENPFTRNIMTIDEDALDSALATDYQAVRNVFEFSYTSDNIDLQIFSRTNGLGVSDATLNIDITNSIYEATYIIDSVATTVTLDAELQSDGSTLLKGKSGTAMDGLVMLYASSLDSTANLHFSQGIGDRLYNTVDALVAEDDGAVGVAISALADDNDRYLEDIADIDRLIERYRETLLEQFSALESAIASANTLLQSLDAQANARNN